MDQCELEVISNEIDDLERVLSKVVEPQTVYYTDEIVQQLQAKVKLLKLELPAVSLKKTLLSELVFWDPFKSAIHENERSSKFEKLNIHINSLPNVLLKYL